MITKKLIEQLKFEENFKRKAYLDSKGILTIGYGHNLKDEPNYKGKRIPHSISESFAEELLIHDVGQAVRDTERKMGFLIGLNQARRDALFNMVFQMGIAKVMLFKNTLKAIENGHWVEAEKEALNSNWAKKDSPNRAIRVAQQIRTGKYYDVQW